MTNLKFKELTNIFKHVEAKNDIKIDELEKLLLKSITYVIHNEIDSDAKIEIINDNKHGLKIINKNKLIEDDQDYKNDYEKNNIISVYSIPLSEAKELNKNAKIGESIEQEIVTEDFSPKINSLIQNTFRFEISKSQREKIYSKYKDKIGQEIDAHLKEENSYGARFILEDGNECFLPVEYWNQKMKLNKELNKVVIERVLEIPEKKYENLQILVSNSSLIRMKNLFEIEIPEIAEGKIEIVSVSRIPGVRTKISFKQSSSYEGELDILGAVIGNKGERINSISRMLGDERFDVVLYSDDPIKYITNSLSPSKVVSINKRSKENDYLAIVPNKQLTLAIGKNGSNVKFAVKLTGFNIDICSYEEALKNGLPIHWNGNVHDINELNLIESQELNTRTRNYNNSQRDKNSWSSRTNFDDLDLDKELAKYKEEMENFQSNFQFNENKSSKNTNIEKQNNNVEFKNEYVKESFNQDEDLTEDLDFEFGDIDFSDFDD